MPEAPLKTGILGLDDTGQLLLEAAGGLDYLTITAVADSDTKLAQQTGARFKCAAFDDYRQLITQNQLDCLLVAAPLHTCAEYLKTALKKKFNILKLPPLARNFSEAAEFVKLAAAEKITLAVANPGRFASSALALKTYILKNPAQQIFFILAGSGKKNAPDPSFPSKWRSDPVLAGGGVVLYDCWEIIDRIVSSFGMPQQVYCAAGSTAADRQQRLYLTEDSAIITMKFSDTLSCCLLAGHAARAVGKDRQEWLVAQGQNMLIKADDKCFEVTDSQDQRIQQNVFDDDCPGRMKKTVENFASCLLWPDKHTPVSTAQDSLNNMAVIEAAYLSARTGMPEEPARILKIA